MRILLFIQTWYLWDHSEFPTLYWSGNEEKLGLVIIIIMTIIIVGYSLDKKTRLLFFMILKTLLQIRKQRCSPNIITEYSLDNSMPKTNPICKKKF